MRLLLDTHALIWLLTDRRHVPPRVQHLVADTRNQVYVSVVSVFEVAARNSAARRGGFNLSADDLIAASREADFQMLSLQSEHAAAVETIANFHGDPFDRLLLAQARVEGLQLVTHDADLAQYDSRTIQF
ncbi:MAG: type II toxin-antitoxin system VapC family toxin [Devosia sp.]|nr:type II toxin-antitoxin system VapC family toxin [Devosia sp.]